MLNIHRWSGPYSIIIINYQQSNIQEQELGDSGKEKYDIDRILILKVAEQEKTSF